MLLAGRRRLDAWIVACLALLAYGSWALVLTTQEHTDPWVRVLPAVPARRSPPGCSSRWPRPATARGTWLGADRPRGALRSRRRPWLCWGLAAVALVAHGRAPRAERDGAGVRPRARPHAAVVPPGGDRRAGAGAARAAVGATVPFLSSRPLVALAAVSFGFFLWHIQVLRVVRPLLDGSAPVAVARAGPRLRRVATWPARRAAGWSRPPLAGLIVG